MIDGPRSIERVGKEERRDVAVIETGARPVGAGDVFRQFTAAVRLRRTTTMCAK